MDLAAGSVSFLVDGGASDHSPAWSSAGDRIAFFTSDNQGNSLWMVDVDGNGLELLTDGANDFDPVWSPDGGSLAFTRRSDDFRQQVFAMRLDLGVPVPTDIEESFGLSVIGWTDAQLGD